jgi:hypothetical protein
MGDVVPLPVKCPECRGDGKKGIIDPEQGFITILCPDCNGSGTFGGGRGPAGPGAVITDPGPAGHHGDLHHHARRHRETRP